MSSSSVQACDGSWYDDDGQADGVVSYGRVAGAVQLLIGTRELNGALLPTPSQPVIVQTVSGQTTVTTLHLHRAATVRFHAVDGDGNPVPGVCLDVIPPAFDRWDYPDLWDGQHAYTVCDGDDNAVDGLLTFFPAPAGTFRVQQDLAHRLAGYSAMSEFTVEANFGQTVDADAVLLKHATVAVTVAADDTGQPIPGAALRVFSPARPCCPVDLTDGGAGDHDGVANGVIVIDVLDPGDYLLGQDVPTRGYFLMPHVPLTVTRQDVSIRVTYERPATLVVSAVGPSGEAIDSSCYLLYHDDGTGHADLAQGPVTTQSNAAPAYCTDPAQPGPITIAPLFPGDYVLVNEEAYVGSDLYLNAPDLPVTLASGQTMAVTVRNPLRGTVVIRSVVAGTATPLPGVCFALHLQNDADNPVLTTVCDGGAGDADGMANGDIAIEGLAGPADLLWEATGVPDGYAVASTDTYIGLYSARVDVRVDFSATDPSTP
jgi:hypothetical protein